MSLGTAETLGIFGHHRINIFGGYPYYMPKGEWKIKTFCLEHDAQEPKGFFIGHGNDHLLFIPDTAYVENRFEGVTQLVVECNNAEDILSEKILNGSIPSFLGRRIRRNHMSLQNVKELILTNDMARTLREIWLIHLSSANSSEERFKKEIQELTGIPVHIAEE